MTFKRFNQILNILTSSILGVFLGHSIYIYMDYQTRPELYDMQSAPWYTSILIYGISALTVLAVCFLLKAIIYIKSKDWQNKSPD